jgi:uncharacterized membrane protein YphA (DoxX/SURF4 family)
MQAAKNILFSIWSYRSVRICIGLVFVYAGVMKLADPDSFADIIAGYGLVPRNLLVPTAVGLPVLEVVAGMGLIFDIRGSLSTILGLLFMFVFVLWFGVLKDLDIDCGCFSAEEITEHGALRGALFRDLWMIAGALYLYGWRWITRSASQGGIRLKEAKIHFVRGANRGCVTER